MLICSNRKIRLRGFEVMLIHQPAAVGGHTDPAGMSAANTQADWLPEEV